MPRTPTTRTGTNWLPRRKPGTAFAPVGQRRNLSGRLSPWDVQKMQPWYKEFQELMAERQRVARAIGRAQREAQSSNPNIANRGAANLAGLQAQMNNFGLRLQNLSAREQARKQSIADNSLGTSFEAIKHDRPEQPQFPWESMQRTGGGGGGAPSLPGGSGAQAGGFQQGQWDFGPDGGSVWQADGGQGGGRSQEGGGGGGDQVGQYNFSDEDEWEQMMAQMAGNLQGGGMTGGSGGVKMSGGGS